MSRRPLPIEITLRLALVATPACAACGGGSAMGKQNENSNHEDPDGAVPRDASTLPDSGQIPDAALPDAALPDAGSEDVGNDPDVDQDGYPASQDCFDHDPSIYPGVTRACQSDCDVGTET